MQKRKELDDVEKGVLDEQQHGNPLKESPPRGPVGGQKPGTMLCMLTVVSRHPQLLVGPAVLFCLIVALCTFGIVHSANDSFALERQQTEDEAKSTADGLSEQLAYASRAALSLGAVVKMKPNWPFLESNFNALAEELFRQSNDGASAGRLALKELNLLPFGRVRALRSKPVQRNSTADVFSPELIDEFNPRDVIAADGLVIQGPNPVSNSVKAAFTAGYPIFFNDTDEDESWGHPDNITHPTGCPGLPCYNPETRRKFWGFASTQIDPDPLLKGNNEHLKRLLAHDMSYLLTINSDNGANAKRTFVRGGKHPMKVSVNVTIVIPGNSWYLSVYNPRLEEIEATRDGLVGMLVVVAFCVSMLLLLSLLSGKRASVCLQMQLETNMLLQEEKVAREALLGRQLDLIACFEQSSRGTKNLRRFKMSDEQLNTLDQIEQARQAMADVSRHGKEEDISCQKLLAEGSFGKVYKGQWRGTEVAVKVIMLPGNMSGREKREKMVVWEAAISSSLVHPNICQTYHYRIKPVKESARSSPKLDVGFAKASDMSGSRPRSNLQVGSDICGDTNPEEVHSFEVHLVLEYCDRLSLRDALDAGAFMTPSGLNYAAQLDCAMEIARAMLHLHCNNVLHLDLKTRNILLSSSSAEGKGLICKVSDFGLSVRMNHMETHLSNLFQGTMTHMAPEVMLKGTCSKQSDVYSFGILLWELFTACMPFHDVPPALLGHLIVKDGKRPAWPAVVPKGYRDLATACWDQNPDARPTFEIILETLDRLRRELDTPTPPLQPYQPAQRPQNRHAHFQETLGSSIQPSLAQQKSLGGRNPHPSQGHAATPKAPTDPAQLPTASQAEALMQAWLQPRGNKQSQSLQSKGSSIQDQAEAPNPQHPPTFYRAEIEGPKRPSTPTQALPRISRGGLDLTVEEGSSSASGKEEEGKTGSAGIANTVYNEAGQGGLNHPQSSAPEGGNESSRSNVCINLPGPPMPGPLMESMLATPPDKRPACPGACSAPPLHSPNGAVQAAFGGSHDSSSCSGGCGCAFCHQYHLSSQPGPHDAVQKASSSCHGSSSCSGGDCHVSSHPSRAIGGPQQPLQGRRSVGWEDTGERQGALGEQSELAEQAVSCKRLSEEG